MQLNPIIAAPQTQAQKPTSLVTPAVQATIAPAVATQLQAAPLSRTQTTGAAQAVGRNEGANNPRSGTETNQSVDTAAGALNARAVGGVGAKRRGMTLDVTV